MSFLISYSGAKIRNNVFAHTFYPFLCGKTETYASFLTEFSDKFITHKPEYPQRTEIRPLSERQTIEKPADYSGESFIKYAQALCSQ